VCALSFNLILRYYKMDKEERIARLLASVEREEREQGLVERPTGAFVRELFLDSGEEDSGLNDDDDENEGEGEVPIEENDEYEECYFKHYRFFIIYIMLLYLYKK
jgi:hypothetical protein